MEQERIVDPKDHSLKKEDMQLLYSQKENPWKYGESHYKCYNKIFSETKDILPDNLTILELGSGEGYFSENMLENLGSKVSRFTGTDISDIAAKRLTEKLDRFKTNNIEITSLGDFDFEDVDTLEKYKTVISSSNLIVAMEALFLAHTPTNVLKRIDKYVSPGTYMLIADSLRLYVVREFPHRKLGYTLLHKVMSPLYKDKYDGKMRSLVAFLTRKS